MRKISTLLITVIITGMFVTGIIAFAGAMVSLPASATFNNSNSTSNAIKTLESMYNITESSQNVSRQGGDYDSDVLSNFIAGAWNSAIQVMAVPAFFGGLIADLTGMAGMPDWFATGLYTIMSVTVLFAVYYFWTGRDS